MKNFKGKAIYQPAGKASEYSAWACNFYVGCSNGCTYCYCKKGILAGVMGQDKPQLKKCFGTHWHAILLFTEELLMNLFELQKHGLFFSFTTDPFLEETSSLTWRAAELASSNSVPIKFLTKKADWVDNYLKYYKQLTAKPYLKIDQKFYSFGFSLTGHDQFEPNASTNLERIEAMRKLHVAGFKTFASIEPIIDLPTSFNMISATNGFCDLYKIGLMSGVKINRNQLQIFIEGVIDQVEFYGAKLYFKDSLLKAAEIERSELPSCCVDRDYKI